MAIQLTGNIIEDGLLRHNEVLAKIAVVVDEAGFGLEELRNSAICHPVHGLVIKEGLDHKELLDEADLVKLEGGENLSKIPEDIVIRAQVIEKDQGEGDILSG